MSYPSTTQNHFSIKPSYPKIWDVKDQTPRHVFAPDAYTQTHVTQTEMITKGDFKWNPFINPYVLRRESCFPLRSLGALVLLWEPILLGGMKILIIYMIIRGGCIKKIKWDQHSESEESENHILTHCSITRQLWKMLLAIFGLQWVISSSVEDSLLGYKFQRLDKQCKKVWCSAPLCLFWCIWKEHNNHAFNGKEQSDKKLKRFLLSSFGSDLQFLCMWKIPFFLYCMWKIAQ